MRGGLRQFGLDSAADLSQDNLQEQPTNSVFASRFQEIAHAFKQIKLAFPGMNILRALQLLHQRIQPFRNRQAGIKPRKQHGESVEIDIKEASFNHPQFQIRQIIPKTKTSKPKVQQHESEERFFLNQHSQPPKKDDPHSKQTLHDNLSSDNGKKSKTAKKSKPEANDLLERCLLWDFEVNNKAHRLCCNKVAPKFSTQEEQERYFEKRLAAQAFCSRGYGLNKVKEEFLLKNKVLQHATEFTFQVIANTPINCSTNEAQALPSTYRYPEKKRYKTVSTAFIGESLRRVECFIREEVDKGIRPFTGPQMRALFSILLNSEQVLPPDEFCMFRRFIKLTFDLGSVSVYEQTVKRLYRTILLSLKGRIPQLVPEEDFPDKLGVHAGRVISRRRACKKA